MNLYRKAKYLMRTYGIYPKKRFGQNFMVDEFFLGLMSSYATIEKSDFVLEVGPGFGFLTRLLAQKSKKVICVEADTRLIEVLRNELDGFDNVDVVEGDILKVAVPSFNELVSNPPFSISSSLLHWLFNRTFDCAVSVFQKEFAERLDAPVGSKGYSRLTVNAFYHVQVELLDVVPKEAFYPPSKVDIVIVRLKPKNPPPFQVEDEKVFDEVVRTLFTQRNRKVRNAVLPFLKKCGLKGTTAVKRRDLLPYLNKRVRELSPEDFGVLANELSA